MIAFFILDLSLHRGAFRVLPDVRSTDKRRGFERFESLIESCLLTLTWFYAMFYFSRIQNEYLRSCDEKLGGFMIGSFSPDGWKAALGTWDYSSNMVGFGAVLAAALALLIIWMVLRQSARDARDYFRDQLDQRPEILAAVSGVAPQKARGQLDNMVSGRSAT